MGYGAGVWAVSGPEFVKFDPEKPRLLDAYCGAGGCTKGYQDAGWHVTGVDLHPQPNYCGDEFFQMDALEALRQVAVGGLGGFAAIHASPPCQVHSDLAHLHPESTHLDLIPQTRELLEQTGLPWVMENVEGSSLRRDYVLCGSMFGLGALCHDGVVRQLRRHRWFETSWGGGLVPSCYHDGQPIGVYGHGGRQQGMRPDNPNAKRSYMGSQSERRQAMEIDWMDAHELAQAIPPAYCEFIGAELLRTICSTRTCETPA